jgi:hypothetical protein
MPLVKKPEAIKKVNNRQEFESLYFLCGKVWYTETQIA